MQSTTGHVKLTLVDLVINMCFSVCRPSYTVEFSMVLPKIKGFVFMFA